MLAPAIPHLLAGGIFADFLAADHGVRGVRPDDSIQQLQRWT